METKTITTEHVWRDHKTELKGFIQSKVNDSYLTEDILQEVFIKVHLNLPSLKNKTKLKSWIYQIARNSIHDHFRKKNYTLDVGKIDILEESEHSALDKFHCCMMPFIQKLPKKYRQALLLSDFKGVSQLNLAQKLKISYSGAKSRVQRARQLLHSYFIACCAISADKYGNIVSHTPKGKCICNA